MDSHQRRMFRREMRRGAMSELKIPVPPGPEELKPKSAESGMGLSERGRWHASWIIPVLASLVVGAIMAGSGIEMIPLISTILAVWLLSTALLWVLTPRGKHLIWKVAISIIVLAAAAVALGWAIKYDRPILFPQIERMITQNHSGIQTSIYLMALVRNTGHQTGYADKWQLELTVDGTKSEGTAIHGAHLPQRIVDEPEISDQEYPPGKPVRGWLSFGFPAIPSDLVEPYFECDSALKDKVIMKLSVWDSKTKHEWSQTVKLSDLARGGVLGSILIGANYVK